MCSPYSQPVVDMLGRGALLGVVVAALLDEARHVRLAVDARNEQGQLLPHLVRLRYLPGHHLPHQDAQTKDVDLRSTP